MISIIVPVYNVEKYIARCLDSILQQTYNEWECIIINDGSIDDSSEICKSYCNKNNKFKYFEQINRGVAAARNKGVDLAVGDYICFIDPDDWVEPQYLEELYYTIEEANVDIVACEYYCSTDNKNEVIHINEKSYLNREETIKAISDSTIESFLWNKIFRKADLKKYKFRDGACYEDVLLFNDIIVDIQSMIIIHKPLYHYYMRNDSIIHVRNPKREHDYFDAFKERYEVECIKRTEKNYILKLLMIEYYYIVEFSIDFASYCKCFIVEQERKNIIKAKKKMRMKERIRFEFAFFFPEIYSWLMTKIRG